MLHLGGYYVSMTTTADGHDYDHLPPQITRDYKMWVDGFTAAMLGKSLDECPHEPFSEGIRDVELLAAHGEGLADGAAAVIEALESLRREPGVPGSAVEGFNLAIDCANVSLKSFLSDREKR